MLRIPFFYKKASSKKSSHNLERIHTCRIVAQSGQGTYFVVYSAVSGINQIVNLAEV
jgi:hypothetical protein